MRNIYLIGFMGAGKSTVARKLCEMYSLRQLEMDEEIEKREKMKISEIFSVKGESYFREVETKLLEECSEKSDMVVSCGGGAAMRECNVSEMKKNGMIVLLDVSAETVYERVRNSHSRPLLEGNMNVEYIKSLLEKRYPKYKSAADIIIDVNGKKVEEISREIIKNVNSR